MLKDRVVDLGSKRVLLPAKATGPAGDLSASDLRAILASDRHSLLVTGESGTGKEVIADCVFQVTKRSKAKCQKINCAGLDRNLVGSELFGHKRGAYTGADGNRDGLLKACDGGVLFLDEIGWLPEDLQARLLRFMEDGKIRPLGADREEHEVDVRIVAATNKDVNDAKVILPDLRHRFDFEIDLPPLRQRTEDIPWLLCEPGFFREEEVFSGISLATLAGMASFSWPGNIRELRKYCQRKTLLRGIEELYGEERHILDDWSLGKPLGVHDWMAFSGVALDAAERRAERDPSFLKEPNVRRVLAILIGLYAATPLFFGIDQKTDFLAIVPFARLRVAAIDELNRLEHFDLRFLTDMFTTECPGANLRYVETSVERGHGRHQCDLGSALSVLKGFVEAFVKVDERFKIRIVTRGGRTEKLNIGPSKKFMSEIGYGGPDGVLFDMPGPPGAAGAIETVLDELKIKGRDRDICVLCHQKKSNAEIAEALKVGKTVVTETLQKWRKIEVLGSFLPIHPAGRKRKKA